MCLTHHAVPKKYFFTILIGFSKLKRCVSKILRDIVG
jgi:hypothetical protein